MDAPRAVLKGVSPFESSCYRAGIAYVVFTSIVELSADVEFTPSIRSGGRRDNAETVMLPPGGRAFNPIAISPSNFSNSGIDAVLTTEIIIIIILSLPPSRPTAHHRLRTEVSLTSSAGEVGGIDADVEKGIQCCAYLAPVECDGGCCRDGNLTCTWKISVRKSRCLDVRSARRLTR